MADLIDYTVPHHIISWDAKGDVDRTSATHINAAPRVTNDPIEPPAWMALGKCYGEDAEPFAAALEFASKTVVARAKAVCAECPVREACLAFEMEQEAPYPGGAIVLPADYRFGIYGGTTPRERYELALAEVSA